MPLYTITDWLGLVPIVVCLCFAALGAVQLVKRRLLVLSVMPTLKFQIDRRSEKTLVRNVTTAFVIAFSLFMVIGRLTAGVHWATDIIGAVLLSFGLFRLYQYFAQLTELHGEKNGVQ